jgi:hypothetical protein
MEGLLLVSHKQMLLLISSQNILAKIGHHQVIIVEYTNDEGIHINYNASIKCLLVETVLDQT